MALSEFELKKYEKAVNAFLEKKRPPAYKRDQLDFGFKVENQSIEIFEIRPCWNDPTEIIQMPVAKTTYVKSQRLWRICWQRADLKWHSYAPHPVAKSLEEFLKVVEIDVHSCFFA